MRYSIRVLPRSATNQLLGPLSDGSYKVKLTAAPVAGKANAALISFLSKTWKIPKHKISIRRGTVGRSKLIEVDD